MAERQDYIIPLDPQYVATRGEIQNTDEVLASFVNEYILHLLVNDAYFKKMLDALTGGSDSERMAKVSDITFANNVTAVKKYPLDARHANPGVEGSLAAQINSAKTALEGSRAPNNHAVSATTYGLGTNTVYGHLKLSDSVVAESSESGGYAATPKAIKTVYDRVTTLTEKNWSVSVTASGFTNTYPFTQDVTVSGMLSTYAPVWSVLNNGNTEANAKNLSKVSGCIQSITTGNGKITIKCIKKPAVNFTLIGKGI